MAVQKKLDTKEESTTPLDIEMLNDLSRKKVGFYCKGAHDANHNCPLSCKGKIDYVMWVYNRNSEFENLDQKFYQEGFKLAGSEHEEERAEREELAQL